MKKFKLATLGCRTNQYETEGYRAQLKKLGFTEAGEGEAADLCIVNSCTVTHSAESESLRQIRKLKKDNPGAKIVATGCAVEKKDSIDGADLIVPNKKKEALVAALFPDAHDLPEFKIERFEAHTRAFVKVQDGCNSFCTYCIIPYVRGRSRSRKKGEILDEITGLIASGYKEIVLTGINIGDYDDGTLAQLVRDVDQIEGLERLRVSSIDPDEVDDDLLDAIVTGSKTSQSMHIVLQAGSNVTLKRMNRKYTRQHFMDAVDRLKKASPDFTFTTDVIVGFPGETERDFQESLDVIEEVEFAKVHMFPYSPRERTKAALYADRVPADVVAERKSRCLRVSEQVAYRLRSKYVGREMSVLVEGKGSGHTDNFLTVKVDPALRPNTLVSVVLSENTEQGLIGHHADQHRQTA